MDNDLKAKLKDKLKICYERYVQEWLDSKPQELIDKAEKIAIFKKMAETIPEAADDSEAEYLIRFSDPLEIVSEAWINEYGGNVASFDDDVKFVLWKLSDSGSADMDYELEQQSEIEESDITLN